MDHIVRQNAGTERPSKRFPVRQIQAATGIPKSTVQDQLRALIRDGWLVEIGKGPNRVRLLDFRLPSDSPDTEYCPGVRTPVCGNYTPFPNEILDGVRQLGPHRAKILRFVVRQNAGHPAPPKAFAVRFIGHHTGMAKSTVEDNLKPMLRDGWLEEIGRGKNGVRLLDFRLSNAANAPLPVSAARPAGRTPEKSGVRDTGRRCPGGGTRVSGGQDNLKQRKKDIKKGPGPSGAVPNLIPQCPGMRHKISGEKRAGEGDPYDRLDRFMSGRISPGSRNLIRDAFVGARGDTLIFQAGVLPDYLCTLIAQLWPHTVFEPGVRAVVGGVS